MVKVLISSEKGFEKKFENLINKRNKDDISIEKSVSKIVSNELCSSICGESTSIISLIFCLI